MQDYISADQNADEISIKAFILGIILTVLLTASTVYLGLKVGLTISASIPAAVISMGVLGLFRRHNILENNIVQTTASSGMSLATGIIFVLPALLIMHVWDHFYFWETMLITLYGGVLGVLFSVPFRKLLLNDKSLHYPEGTAIGYVLKAKGQPGLGLKKIIYGGLASAAIVFSQTGLKIFSESADLWSRFGKTIGGVSFGFSPVLVGAGYIVGGTTALSIAIGIILGWFIGIPWVGLIYGVPETDNLTSAVMSLWSQYVRYIGVGVILVGSLYVFALLMKAICAKYKHSPLKKSQLTDLSTQDSTVIRTERDLPMSLVVFGSLAFAIPIYFAYKNGIDINILNLPDLTFLGFNSILVAYTLIAGLIFSVVCGYIVGVVGSSASPFSSLALCAILIVSMIIFSFLGGKLAFADNPAKAQAAATLSILVGLVVTCAAAIMNDTIQDLKVGDMIGATPWKLEIMQIVGVIVGAIVTPPVLELLFQAYGIGGVYPRPDMDPTASLSAPQAQLMAAIAKAIFNQNAPWALIGIGAIIAVVIIAIDYMLKKTKRGSLSIIAVGIGIYVPIFATSALVLGGAISALAERKLRQQNAKDLNIDAIIQRQQQSGFLLASGLIAGGSLVGILLAIPFVLLQDTNALALVGPAFSTMATILGSTAAIGICYWMYRITVKNYT